MSFTRARIRLLAIYALLLLPFTAFGAWKALQANNNSPIDWVNSNFPARAEYDHFTELFGSGDAVIAGWDECRLDDPRLDRLVQAFHTASIFRLSDGKPCFHAIHCGRQTVLQMSTPPASAEMDGIEPDAEAEAARALMRRETAVRRLKGTLVGPDNQSTCVVLIFTREGLENRARVVHLIRRAIAVCFDISDSEIHLAGPVIDGLSVDEASQRSLSTWAAPSALVIFIICWISLRSLRGALLVFGTAVWCQGTTLAIIHYSGDTLSALLIVIPPLVQVLAVAGGIHLTNYYFEALATRTPSEAAVHCFLDAWLPCSLSSGTTMMGTASLMVSELEPIRLFGAYATIGVGLTLIGTIAVIPCGLYLFPIRRTVRNSTEPSPVVVSDAWQKLTNLLNQRNTTSLVILFGLMIVLGCGVPKLQTSVRIETLFAEDHRLLADYRWLEEKIGPLVPLEVMLTFDESCRLSNRQRLERIHQLDRSVKTISGISATTSVLTFFPELPPMGSLPERMKAAAINRAFDEARPLFENVHVLRTEDTAETWRLTAHCSAIQPIEYEQLLKALNAAAHAAVLNTEGKPYAGVSVTTSGIMPLVHQIQRQLLNDLYDSLVSALIVITLTMTIAEAGFLNGLLAMMSNIFPLALMFGLMGWLQEPMDIGSVMTASVALGIAVDDTLHFLTFFRRSLAGGMSRYDAVLFSYRHCGPAMIMTSVTCTLGLSVFAGADFLPTARFALMMIGLLATALAGDMLLLPALLLSPFGKVFEQQDVVSQANQNSPFTSPP